MTMSRASVFLVLAAVMSAACTDDPASLAPDGGSETTERSSPTPSGSTPAGGPVGIPVKVTCDGRSTSIADRVAEAGPGGVRISARLDTKATRLVFDAREKELLVVDPADAPVNLAPGKHTVGCMYEGDLVYGEESFEVTDPSGHYVDPLGDCEVAGMADFEPITVRQDNLLDAATRTWEVRADQVIAAGYPESLHERAFVAFGGPAGTASPTGVVWFESRNDGTWRSSGLVSCKI